MQSCKSADEVIRETLRQVGGRDANKLLRGSDRLDATALSHILRKMTASRKRTTLFFDELGNLIANLEGESWDLLSVLRKFSQTGGLRIVLSCFQEAFLRQQSEFAGPLVNFAHTMRIRAFTRQEVKDFVLVPLRFWGSLKEEEEDELVDVVTSRVGTHPFLLQYFCHAFFQRFSEAEETGSGITRLGLAQQANALCNANLIECFESAVDELFFRIPSALLQLLFLRRCREAETTHWRLDQVEFTDSWVESALRELGYEASSQSLRSILESLELHSLCSGVTDRDPRMRISAPVIYQYVSKTVPSIDQMLKRLAEDARKEREHFGLVLVT